MVCFYVSTPAGLYASVGMKGSMPQARHRKFWCSLKGTGNGENHRPDLAPSVQFYA